MDLNTKGLWEELKEGSLTIHLIKTGKILADPLTKAVILDQLQKLSDMIFTVWSPVKGCVESNGHDETWLLSDRSHSIRDPKIPANLLKAVNSPKGEHGSDANLESYFWMLVVLLGPCGQGIFVILPIFSYFSQFLFNFHSLSLFQSPQSQSLKQHNHLNANQSIISTSLYSFVTFIPCLLSMP